MVEYLEAPFPYIVGVPRDLWKYIYEQKWDVLGEEVVAFDIDNNRVFQKEDLPDFPQPYTQLLIQQLEIQIDKSKQLSARTLDRNSEFSREEDKFWNTFTLKVKQQFLNFLIFLINTFENFYVKKEETPNKNSMIQSVVNHNGTLSSTLDSSRIHQQQNNTTVGFGNNGSANDIFNFEEYVQNVTENQQFFEKFVRTQAFINFIEQAYYEEQGNLSDASIRFFKECTRKLSKENLQAVRSMQDNMINSLIHKFNDRGISYSIDKCHLIYEKTLRMIETQFTQNLNNQGSQNETFGLIQKLNHNKIIKMKQFDPTQLIQQKFTKGQETIFDMQSLQKQRQTTKQQNKNQYLQPEQLSILNTNINLPEYFTIQATPNSVSRVNFEIDNQFLKDNVNKTTNLIKIEDDYDVQDFEDSKIIQPDQLILEESEENSSGEKEGTGFLGFFKKTFSSVKKTFESTFNPANANINTDKVNKSKSQQRPAAQSTYSQSRPGLYTPNLIQLENNQEQESPEIIGGRRNSNQQKTQNRAARSQTFHVNNSVQNNEIILLQEQQKPNRDRKNNNSFLQSLWNLGSSRKDKNNQDVDIRKISSLSPTKPNEEQKIIVQNIQKRNRNRTLNNSGFFIFNEEDMKNMTEMSPTNLYKKSQTTTNDIGQIQILKFDYKQNEAQFSSRQQPRIKNPPILDQQQNQLMSRFRSISYQNQNRQISSNHNSNSKRKLLDEMIISQTYQKITEEQSQNFKTQTFEQTRTYAINSQGFSPIQVENETRNYNNDMRDTQQIVFNLDDIKPTNIKSFQQTPKLSTQQSQKHRESKDEFEEIYKKSTENLLYAPTVMVSNNKPDKFSMWKSQTGKISMKSAAQKPPKHHYQVVKKGISSNLGSQNSKNGSKQLINSTQGNKIKGNNQKEDKINLQKSLTSDMYNDRNSTDDDLKAPILGKNLSQFHNIMHNKHFEKQNIINQSSATQSIKNRNIGAPSVTNFSLQNKGSQNKAQLSHSGPSGASSSQRHKRLLSKGMQNLHVPGETNIPTIENIEPDDENKQKQNNKQIEALHLGRVRKKSGNKTSNRNNIHQYNNNYSRKGSQATLGINNQNSNNLNKSQNLHKALNQISKNDFNINKLSVSNHNSRQNNKQMTSSGKYAAFTAKQSVSNNNLYETTKQLEIAISGISLREQDLNFNNNIQSANMQSKVSNNNAIPVKTVQSSDYSSCQSQFESQQHDDSIVDLNQSKNEIQDQQQLSTFNKVSNNSNSNRNQLNFNSLKNKDAAPLRIHRPSSSQAIQLPSNQRDSLFIDSSNFIVDESSYISIHSQDDDTSNIVHQNSQSYINTINQSIDLRDSKKGDLLRLRSQAGVISPTNQIKKVNESGNEFNNNTLSRQEVGGGGNSIKQQMINQIKHNSYNLTNSNTVSNYNSNLQKMTLDMQTFGKIAASNMINEQNNYSKNSNNNNSNSNVQSINSVNKPMVGRLHSQSQHTKITNNFNQQEVKSHDINLSPRDFKIEGQHQILTQRHRVVNAQIDSINNLSNNLSVKQNTNFQQTQHLSLFQQQSAQQSLTHSRLNIHTPNSNYNHNTHSTFQQHHVNTTVNNLSSIPPMQGLFKHQQQQQQQHQFQIAHQSNRQKPLNKITWDAFSQIAKLSGDVDHEPNTPRSGDKNNRKGGFNRHNTTDDIGNMSDCDDLE